jgi:hypothetical protein
MLDQGQLLQVFVNLSKAVESLPDGGMLELSTLSEGDVDSYETGCANGHDI